MPLTVWLFIVFAVSVMALLIYLGYVYESKVIIPGTKKRVLPKLERHGYTFIKMERVEGYLVHQVNGDRGDFEDGDFPWENFSKKKPYYYYLTYKNKDSDEVRCTVRVLAGFFFLGPVYIDFMPEL